MYVKNMPQTGKKKKIITKVLILTLGIGDGSGRSLVASSLKTQQELFNAG